MIGLLKLGVLKLGLVTIPLRDMVHVCLAHEKTPSCDGAFVRTWFDRLVFASEQLEKT